MALREPWHEIMSDTGCRLHPSCLSCPLPECSYEPEGKERAASAREAQIAAFLTDYAALPSRSDGQKVGVERLAAQHGVGRRTAFRWAQREKP